MRYSLKKRLLFICFSVFCSIALLEACLHLFAFLCERYFGPSSNPGHSPIIPDARLGHRPNPYYPGHDSNGFRNPKALEEADIVTLGDSHTYGTGVSAEDPWPRKLESKVNASVYNMAFGGFGPAHSLILWNEAVALKPQIVVEAFYTGNDLFDSFNLVYNQGQLAELKTSNLQQVEVIRSMEASKPISLQVNKLFRMGTKAVLMEPVGPALITRHSKIYSLLHRAQYELRRKLRKKNRARTEWEVSLSIVKAHPEYFEVFKNKKFRTVFTSEYRMAATNLEDPRIAEGLNISLQALQKMNALASSKEIRFFVILVPTKEAVFSCLINNPTSRYRSLREKEEQVRRITKNFLDRNAILYIDALPALQKQFEAASQPYAESVDGHPNEFGHEAIAQLIASYLKSQNLL